MEEAKPEVVVVCGGDSALLGHILAKLHSLGYDAVKCNDEIVSIGELQKDNISISEGIPETLNFDCILERDVYNFEEVGTLVVESSEKTKGKHKYPFYHKGKF